VQPRLEERAQVAAGDAPGQGGELGGVAVAVAAAGRPRAQDAEDIDIALFTAAG
jgi:hypothetical protein